ncbi:MAG: hypothetical protein KatS3mg108_2923 [Isosphaeraceae bacterium]|jgi:NAD(P)H-hydrate epimerase|nr:MAG: hypothetical protein KatS3mg108_2923 [Isosphaeraceae bacterium]
MIEGCERVESVPRLPARSADAHKGQFGRILVVAGSRGMAGAAALVGASALRSGAGLVRVASPLEVQPTVASFEPSYMTWPLPQDEAGRIDFRAGREPLRRLMSEADVLAIGPGLGQGGSIGELVNWTLSEFNGPAVVDADGLNALAAEVAALTQRLAPTVITPHPGEFARLTGWPTGEVQARRIELAVDLAQRSPAGSLVVVLKGHQTVVTEGRRFYVNTTGNPGMATGGAGDCLTGVIAALLGQGLAGFEAACLGAYVHGLAGDIARDQSGEVGLIAGDIVDALPDAFLYSAESD